MSVNGVVCSPPPTTTLQPLNGTVLEAPVNDDGGCAGGIVLEAVTISGGGIPTIQVGGFPADLCALLTGLVVYAGTTELTATSVVSTNCGVDTDVLSIPITVNGSNEIVGVNGVICAPPVALWNNVVADWVSGSEGAFYVSDPTNGISLQTAAGAPLSNCTTGVADVEMEVYKDGVLDGAASYEYGAFMLAALSTSLNWGQYLPHFGFFTVENGSIFIFDKAQWAQATGAFGKTAAEAAALEFRIRAKDCYGVWSNWDVTNVEKQQILGGDNTLTDNGGGSYSEQVIGGLYATDDPALTVGSLVICAGINHVSAPFLSGTLDNTAWEVRSYTIGSVTNGTTQPVYNLTGEPRLDLVNELERIHSGYDWNFGNNAITDALYPNCTERAGGYYYSQPIGESATDLLELFAVGNAVYSTTAAVYYHINPVAWF